MKNCVLIAFVVFPHGSATSSGIQYVNNPCYQFGSVLNGMYHLTLNV